jgi:hypothetical protein
MSVSKLFVYFAVNEPTQVMILRFVGQGIL